VYASHIIISLYCATHFRPVGLLGWDVTGVCLSIAFYPVNRIWMAAKSTTIFGSSVLLSKNSQKSKFSYNLYQNETNSMLEKIIMKRFFFQKGPKISYESKSHIIPFKIKIILKNQEVS